LATTPAVIGPSSIRVLATISLVRPSPVRPSPVAGGTGWTAGAGGAATGW